MSEDAVEIPEKFAHRTDSATNSRDSALQYVAVDILEAGGSTDAQEALLEPVEEEIREHWKPMARQGLAVAFMAGPQKGAEKIVEELLAELEYEDVPAEHVDEVREAVEERLEQKQYQIELTFDAIMTDAKRRAVNEVEEDVFEWVTVL